MTNWIQINYFLTTIASIFGILAIFSTIRLIYLKTNLNLAFLVIIAILIVIIVWAIWACYTYNLPCSMVEAVFTINGTEFQYYAQRCGF